MATKKIEIKSTVKSVNEVTIKFPCGDTIMISHIPHDERDFDDEEYMLEGWVFNGEPVSVAQLQAVYDALAIVLGKKSKK